MSASQEDQFNVNMIEMSTQPGSSLQENPNIIRSSNEKTSLIQHPVNSGRNYVLPAPKLEVFQQKIEEATRDIEKSIDEEEGDDDDDDDVGEDGGTALAIIFVIYVLVALMNRLFQKLQTIPMYNYPLFLNLLTTFAYVPVSFMYIIPMIRYGSMISKEQTQIPKYKFAVMGTLDCLSSIMAMFAVNYIANASTIVLIQQSAIPISMAFSKLTLGAIYSGSQVKQYFYTFFKKMII